MRVLVCGGRTYGVPMYPPNADAEQRQTARTIAYREVERLRAALDKLDDEGDGIDCIIHGAANGADRHASDWAGDHAIANEPYEADWENQGTFAGPARNKRMLQEGRPDLVVAFPGGKGTRNMIELARKAGVEVVEIA